MTTEANTNEDFTWNDIPEEGNLQETKSEKLETAPTTVVVDAEGAVVEETEKEKSEKETKKEKPSNTFEDFNFGELPEDQDTLNVATTQKANKEKLQAAAEKAIGGSAENNENTPPDDVSEFYIEKANLMVSSGIFKHVDKEDIPETLDENGYKELNSLEQDRRLEHTLEKWKENLDPTSAAFLQHSINGGSYATFQQKLGNIVSFSDLDPSNEKQQSEIISRYIKSVEGNTDSEDIQDRINLYKDKKTLAAKAEAYHSKMIKIEKDRATDLENKAKTTRKRIKEKRGQDKETLTKIINEEDTLAYMKTKKLKADSLPKYMIDPVHEDVNSGNYLTSFQNDLKNILSNNKSFVQLAALVKMFDKENNKFDFSGIKQKAVNEKVEKVKNTLMTKRKNKEAIVETKEPIKPLAALFDAFE